MKTYSELLNTQEWQDCREEILAKYGQTCQHCGMKMVDEVLDIPLALVNFPVFQAI